MSAPVLEADLHADDAADAVGVLAGCRIPLGIEHREAAGYARPDGIGDAAFQCHQFVVAAIAGHAVDLAEATHHDRLAARIWLDLALYAALRDPDAQRGTDLLRRAEAANTRIDADAVPRSQLAFVRGKLAQLDGDLAGAEAEIRRGLSLLDGVDEPRAAWVRPAFLAHLAMIATADGRGRVPAVELMICTRAIGHMIRAGKLEQIYSAIEGGRAQGMQTLEQSLATMLAAGWIDAAAARAHARDQEALERLAERMGAADALRKEG